MATAEEKIIIDYVMSGRFKKDLEQDEKSVLWEGKRPCSECGSKIHSKWETTARAWVCAGCYNELAFSYGWESI